MYDEDLANLEEWLRRLKIEYHIFFSGNRSKPPDDLRIRVERLVKKLSESPELTFSQRFRFSTLVTRYYVYRDLWRRTQQDREMGKGPRGTGISESSPEPPKQEHPVEAIRISISDPEKEGDKVRLLYEALLRVKGAEPRATELSYSQFARYIETRTRGIREKYHCPKVAFTIALEEDAIRFTAAAENR